MNEGPIKLVNDKARRVWFITDTHLGVRNNSNEWIDQTREYFFDWFFPLVRKNYQPGDVLIHLGDFFDSRQSINLKVLNLGISIAEELSSIFTDGVYVIVGNHDIFGKNTNEVNSLKSIKWVPGINIFEDPVTLKLMDKNFFLMPWRKDHNAETETLEYVEPHDVLCCHADIRGLKFNKYVNVESGADVTKFKKFTKVYSGHIHYSQKYENITMLGSPYELTRSDMDNPKSITVLNLEDMIEMVHINTFSPRFKKFYFGDILESTPDELEPKFRNNFVDIMIDPVMALKAPLSMLTDMITTQRFLKFHPYDPDKSTTLTDQMVDSDSDTQFNVLDFIKAYVDSMDSDDDVKKKIITSLFKLHTMVVNQEQEKKL
jgi:DNA repair exonuclease SbcCD nuclease subunit